MFPGLYGLANSAIGNRIPVQAPWWPVLVLLPAGFLFVTALDPKKGAFARVLALAGVALAVAIVLVRDIFWVSGWLGLAACLATVTYVHSKKVFLVGMVLVAVVVLAYSPFFYQNVIVESSKAGDYDRIALMKGAWRYATTFPLGVGPGNYRSYNSFYYGRKWGTTAYTSAHGTYTQHLSEMGIPGLVLFLAIPICGFRWLLRRYRKMPSGFSRNFVLGAMGQLVGISLAALIGDYVIPTYHNGGLVTFSATVYSWLIWGLAVSHVRLAGRQDDGPNSIHSELEYAGTAGPVSEVPVRRDRRP
jgi:O-antigen ligase